MEKIVGATIVDDLNTIPDHVKNNNELSREQKKEYLAHLVIPKSGILLSTVLFEIPNSSLIFGTVNPPSTRNTS